MRLVISVAIIAFILLASLAFGAEPPVVTFVGTDQDRVGTMGIAHDGKVDFHLKLVGIPAEPITRVVLESDNGGVWETPGNGKNWVVLVDKLENSTVADLYAGAIALPKTFVVTLTYASGLVQKIADIGTTPLTTVPIQSVYDRVANGTTIVAARLVQGQVLIVNSVVNPGEGTVDVKIVVEAR